jgi:cation:H+ antiporter
MMIPFLLLFLGLVILTVGAEFLVKGASRLAYRFGVNALVVGLTVVAFGTSAPELAVSINASVQGNGAIAVGNIVGSNIFNIAFILGLAALLCPLTVHAQIIRREMPVVLGASLLFPALLMTGGGLVRWEGCLLFGGVIVYTVLAIRMARRETAATLLQQGVVLDPEQEVAKRTNPFKLVGFILAGLVLLVFGSKLMVDNSITIARHWGINDAIVGLTIVAAGTSLPELATSVVASFRKQTDIAIGNIVGSNIFNLLCIGGASGIIASPVNAGGVTMLDFGFMIGTALLVLPLMKTGFTLKRWEGAVLIASYGLYLYLIWPSAA